MFIRKTIKLKNLIAKTITNYQSVCNKINDAYSRLKSNFFDEENSDQKKKYIFKKNLKAYSNRCFIRKLLKSESSLEEAKNVTKESNLTNIQENTDTKDAQRSFNKYVKYKVNKKFGENVRLYSQIRALDRNIMKKIKGKL